MFRGFLAVAAAAAMLTGCGRGASGSAQRQAGWTTGYWFWNGSSAVSAATVPLDVLYIHSGDVRRNPPFDRERPWGAYGALPEDLPQAREYWLVYRYDDPGLPETAAIPPLRLLIGEQLGEAKRRGLPVAGVQLDIDSPTGRLTEYAALLKEVRAGLPAGVKLSITALLDWVRPRTAFGRVAEHVDEFVPQFYDTGEPGSRFVIAAQVDAQRYGPLFERAGKPYRIGISTFGRGRFVPAQTGGSYVSIAPDLSLRDAAMLPGMVRTQRQTPAGELQLSWKVQEARTMGWRRFAPGDRFEFVLPTPESVRAAIAGAKAMGPNCLGAVFFRWPAEHESLAMEPDTALRAAGIEIPPASLSLDAGDGGCAAVHCTDLYLSGTDPLSPETSRYRIASSVDFDYFVPDEGVPGRMSGPREIELKLPPFSGRSRLRVGRAVTIERAEYRLLESER